MSEQSSEFSRRDLLRNVALAATLGGLSAEAAQHVHHIAAAEKQASGGVYKPKCFNAHEYKTLQRLADLIVPAEGRFPSASAAGAPEFIDLLCSQNDDLAAIYTGGLAWIDAEMQRLDGARFADASLEQQTALLDRIAYRKNDSPQLGPGIRFFEWARKMTVDAYYTSAPGIQDLGFLGNTALSEFKVPPEALQYALKRSGLA